jgi:hypothetical protein
VRLAFSKSELNGSTVYELVDEMSFLIYLLPFADIFSSDEHLNETYPHGIVLFKWINLYIKVCSVYAKAYGFFYFNFA